MRASATIRAGSVELQVKPVLGRRSYRIVTRMSRTKKHLLLLGIDVVTSAVALVLTMMITHSSFWPAGPLAREAVMFPVLAIFAGVTSEALGIPRIKLNSFETSAILRTAFLAVVLAASFHILSGFHTPDSPGGTSVLYGLVFFLTGISARYAMLRGLLWIYRQGVERRRVMIYGAGSTGMQLEAALRTHEMIEAVAFIDDSPALQKMTVAGLPVLPPSRVEPFARLRGVRRVLLAVPSLSPPKQAQIARRFEAMGMEVQVLPSFAQLVGDEPLVDKFTSVTPGSLLGRNNLEKEIAASAAGYKGRSIMVTGAGGSIGSELCRQILSFRPRRLVLFEMSEFALYTVEMELRGLMRGAATEIVPVLGSVTDPRLVRTAIERNGVEVLLHAAAYKHVPLVEANPLPGLANNVLGTRTVAEAAHAAGVRSFILISSDKAVRPTNIMGASKRLAELVVQDLAQRSKGTVFSMVRFGNVLGSSGSVVPLFADQIGRGGPITLTHPDVTRFFMTIPEAVRLVLLAGSFAREDGACGGDVFVLDMGDPVRIHDLACRMIEAAGYTLRNDDNPDGDIEIVVTGLRPGEKLHEELLIGQGLLATPHPKILRAQENALSEIEVAVALRGLRSAVAAGDEEAARAVVARWVEGFAPASQDQGAARAETRLPQPGTADSAGAGLAAS